MNNISVIIPAYKNKKQLLENLAHNMPFLKGCEIIVLNDDPSESIAQDVSAFPDIKLIENKKNLGFGATVNTGVHSASRPYIFLLNTDVKLFDDTFMRALKAFAKDDMLFGVSFAQKERDGAIIGKNRIYWKSGFIYHNKAGDLKKGLNGWAEGGSCILDKTKFLRLGGFDPLYAPFYWEDTDLSYRAWKCGYTVIFDPDIEVEHHHESTIGKYFKKNNIKIIDFRNQLIFIWKNITDRRLLLLHLFFLEIVIIKYTLKGDFSYIKGYIEALKKLPLIISHRRSQTKQYKQPDSQVLLHINE